MTSPRPGDLTRRIEHLAQQGWSREEIVRELVQGGLSEAGAERFVDRVQGRLGGSKPPAAPGGAGDGVAWGSLVKGTFWLSLGSCATAVTFLLAEPGEKVVLAYGAILAGLLLVARGIVRWRRTSAPFPGLAVAGAAALPLVGSVALVAFVSYREAGRREAAEVVRLEREEAALQERRRREEEEERARRQSAAMARERRLAEARAADIQREVLKLRDPEDALRACGGAKTLARLEAREAIPELEVRLQDRDNVVKNCVAGALLDLGEVDTALAAYVEWAGSENSFLRATALIGFGRIGPPAAAAALPYLEKALRSPDVGTRYSAVAALSKIGDVAEPLLREATNDPERSVSGLATQVLEDLERVRTLHEQTPAALR
jgi:hypothetical protein